MTARRFPIESGHVQQFARAIGDTADHYSDAAAESPEGLSGTAIPPTFLMSSAQFDPDYSLRPKPGQKWFGSGANPTGAGGSGGNATDSKDSSHDGKVEGKGAGGGALHAEQRFEFHRPVRVGEVLSTSIRPGKSWEKQGRKGGTMRFSESVTEYIDAAGEVVASATAVAVHTSRAPSTEESR